MLVNSDTNIVFHGKKNREDMAQYYQASDFLIISLIDKPIFSVTVPAKTQTYISAKKPILAIINGDTANMIKDNNLGLCVSPSDIDAISSVLKKCIRMSKSERDVFTENNEKLINTIFNKNKTIDNLLEILVEDKL